MPFDIKTDLRIQYEKPSGTWNNMQADSYEIDIDRGIDIESGVFARPTVGTATIKMMKSNVADFMNGPDYGSNQRIRIEYLNGGVWSGIFTGYIQNIEMTYVTGAKTSGTNGVDVALSQGKLQVTITANDMTRLALNTQIGTFNITGTSARSFVNLMNQLGTAITAVDSRYSQTQTLTGGSSTYQYANTYLDVSSGELYNTFLDAELGWLYASRNSGMRYLTRSDVNTIQGYAWDTASLTVSNIHSSSNLHVCMDHIELGYVSDNIANQVKVTNTATGLKSTVTNSSSVTAYGRQLAEFDITLDPTTGSTLANWATEVSGAANPKSIRMISVPAIRRNNNPSALLDEDIGRSLQVEFAQTGFTTLQERYMIARINHSITADHWELNLGLWRGM